MTLTANPNYEAKSSYSFTVMATDAAGNFGDAGGDAGDQQPGRGGAERSRPVRRPAAINENSGAGQVVYTATADRHGGHRQRRDDLQPEGGTDDFAPFSINSAAPAR